MSGYYAVKLGGLLVILHHLLETPVQGLVSNGVAPASYARYSSCRPHTTVLQAQSSQAKCQSTHMAATAAQVPVKQTGAAVDTRTWKWRGYTIRYQVSGEGRQGPPTILVHGFGGNADHWRKNLPELGQVGPTYALDLLGYGFSDKPDPGPWAEKNQLYNFETWGDQVLDFAKQIVGKKVFIASNSVGGLAALQAALVGGPDLVHGLVILNVSLRMLHTKKQSPFQRPLTTALQYVLRETALGPGFFTQVAQAKTVKNILQQCYGDKDAVTDELVECILKPGLEPGATKVFLDFISYSGGPLPEDLLPLMKVPVIIGWGEKDPWEPLAMGRAYAEFDAVEDFVVFPGAGHCPQDEVPHLVNPMISAFVQKHYKP